MSPPRSVKVLPPSSALSGGEEEENNSEMIMFSPIREGAPVSCVTESIAPVFFARFAYVAHLQTTSAPPMASTPSKPSHTSSSAILSAPGPAMLSHEETEPEEEPEPEPEPELEQGSQYLQDGTFSFAFSPILSPVKESDMECSEPSVAPREVLSFLTTFVAKSSQENDEIHTIRSESPLFDLPEDGEEEDELNTTVVVRVIPSLFTPHYSRSENSLANKSARCGLRSSNES